MVSLANQPPSYVIDLPRTRTELSKHVIRNRKFLKLWVEPAQNADCGTTVGNNIKEKSVISDHYILVLAVYRSREIV